MLGFVVFAVLIFVEVGLLVLGSMKKSNVKMEKAMVRIALFFIFLLLVITPIIDWGFQWFLLALLLGIQALFGIVVLVRKKSVTSKKWKLIIAGLGQVLLIGMAFFPVLLFPQYDEIKPTGEYSVETKSYTWVDESREENFTDEDDKRKVTIQFWYPSDHSKQEKYPLVIFSHGAFGYRMSNFSTFQELASNGYIVGSIDHTYHAFMTKQEDGETIIGNLEFINNAMGAQNGDLNAEKVYELEQEWMKLRTDDMAFILDYIKDKTSVSNGNSVFQSIDLEHIGVLGHSLGGATAAQIGRDDKDVDAVVVIDGTMMGETIGFENEKEVFTDIPYPKPIMNLYNESHYKEAFKLQDEYANMVVTKNAMDSHQVVIEGSEHMNFTDLPIVSPFLSGLLGTGEVDARECIQTTNELILKFFDHYLKSSSDEIPKIQSF